MSAVLLYKQGRTGRTGKALARALGIPVSNNGGRIPLPSLLIRWGSHEEVSWGCSAELNRRASIFLASSKSRALRRMEEMGVRTPKFILPDEVGPAIGRASTHQQGRDIRIFDEGERLEGCDHYLEIIPSEKEFRVHCFQGEVLVTQVKVMVEDLVIYPERNGAVSVWIRNFDRGWRFKRIQERPRLSKIALAATSALGLDFGAVDIIKDSRDGEYVVLEVNTAPALEGTTLERYVKAFKMVIESLQG